MRKGCWCQHLGLLVGSGQASWWVGLGRGGGIYKAEVGCHPGKKINHACTSRMGFRTSGGLGAGS